jgi:hypothetical protein
MFTITVSLITPVAMNKGLRFAIREGGRTVGAGQVTERFLSEGNKAQNFHLEMSAKFF